MHRLQKLGMSHHTNKQCIHATILQSKQMQKHITNDLTLYKAHYGAHPDPPELVTELNYTSNQICFQLVNDKAGLNLANWQTIKDCEW